jgi:hypothetical protein
MEGGCKYIEKVVVNSQQVVILQHGRLGEVLTPPGRKNFKTAQGLILGTILQKSISGGIWLIKAEK